MALQLFSCKQPFPGFKRKFLSRKTISQIETNTRGCFINSAGIKGKKTVEKTVDSQKINSISIKAQNDNYEKKRIRKSSKRVTDVTTKNFDYTNWSGVCL